jgi:hypothetical protein
MALQATGAEARSTNGTALTSPWAAGTTSTSSIRKTSSNGPEYFESRSRMRMLTLSSSPTMARFLACCVDSRGVRMARSAGEVDPARGGDSWKNRTYRDFSRIVSTVATIPSA